MGAYDIMDTAKLLAGNTYPGRGIIAGRSEDGRCAVAAYFIMGRSENSRNRIFREKKNGDVYTAAFDESKVADPTLIIYNAVRSVGDALIVTNGSQTDTIYDFLTRGKSFSDALRTRRFEPDAPNYTPRVSALIERSDGDFTLKMNILKSADRDGTDCSRYFFEFGRIPEGTGRFIHTYDGDGSPIPSFTGEPEPVSVPGDIEDFSHVVWESLDENNKISLYVRFVDLATGRYESRLINKNK